MKLLQTMVSALCITTLVACGGAEERKSVYLEKAKASLEAGDLDKARVELKNVLQIDPKDSDAYYQLGKVYEQQSEFGKAFRNYKRAEELNPELLINKARLGRLYLILGNDIDEAQKTIDYILSREPEHPEGLLLKAALLMKDDKVSDALELGKEILARDPGNADAAMFVSTIYTNDKDYDSAVDVIDKALLTNSKDNQLKNMLAIILTTIKDYERAEVIFKEFLEEYPEKRLSYDRLASFYNTSDDKVKAEQVLRDSVSYDPEDVDRHLVLVKYLQEIKGDQAAIDELRSAADSNKSIARLRMALAELHYSTGDKQSAISVYEQAIDEFPDELTEVESRIALATIFINDGAYDKAGEMVAEALKDSPNDPNVHFLKARVALKEGDTESAIISLRIVVKELPARIEAHVLLANIYRAQNEDELVKSTLNNAHDYNKKDAGALLKLARYYMSSNLDSAEKVVDDLLKVDQFNYEGLSIRSVIYNQKERVDEAYVIAKQLIELYPDKPNGYLQVAPYYVKNDNLKDAISKLEIGYLNVEDNRKILSMLTTFQLSVKQFSQAEDRLMAELKSSPDDAELNLLLANVYLASARLDDAEKVLLAVTDKHPEVEQTYMMLARLYRESEDREARISILKKGVSNIPSSHKMPLILATMYEQSAEYDMALGVYRDMYKVFPDNLVVMNNYASMISDHSDSAADLELAKELALKLEATGLPAFLDTVGWVYYKTGDHAKALEFLNKVVETSPEVNIFNYHLGMAYKMSGDNEKARIYLEKSLSDGKDFKGRKVAEKALREI